MHSDSLELDQRSVSGTFIPDKYFHVDPTFKKIQAITVTGNPAPKIFVGTDHGLYRSDDYGKSWQELKEGLFNQDIRSLAVNPEDPKIIFAGTSKGIFKSENSGDQWTDWFEESTGLGNIFINDLLVDPTHPETVFAATRGGLFLSVDGGESWEPAFTGDVYEESKDVRVVRFSALNTDTLYIGTGRGSFRSINRGHNWERKWEDVPPGIISLAVLKTDPEFIFAGTTEGLYKSFNRGITWLKDLHRDIGPVKNIYIDPENNTNLYLSTGAHLLFSSDGGDHWHSLAPNKKNIKNDDSHIPAHFEMTHVRKLITSRPFLLAGTTSGLFMSSDNGKTWTLKKLGTANASLTKEDFKMDLAKLVTEIHNGRFFGSYFYLVVDLATVGLILLTFSGFFIGYYRHRLKKRKKETVKEELGVDVLIDLQETADDLSHESQKIHDMIEHINNHLQKCKAIYMTKEKNEIQEVGKHINTLDKKMHHLMENIGEFSKWSQN